MAELGLAEMFTVGRITNFYSTIIDRFWVNCFELLEEKGVEWV